MANSVRKDKPVLVTGATGYVGGRLVPLLLESGYRVRAMGRSLAKLKGRPWASHPNLTLAQGDVSDPVSLGRAVDGCWAAFYLVHAMLDHADDFAERDRQAARNMVAAAEAAGLERIIYLGGLGDMSRPGLSEHLRSRQEVAHILQSGRVPATFLRAAVILGSGSVSFEIIRYLVERLPVMITPRWVNTLNQPIAIRNVLHYLRGCLETDAVLGETFDIGGPDILTYRNLFDMYAEEAGLAKRRIIPIPFLTIGLSARWIHLITPIPSAIAMSLAEGLRNEVVCGDNRIRDLIPQELIGCRETLRLAIGRIREDRVDTCWSDAACLLPPEWVYCGDADYSGGTILQCAYRVVMEASPGEIWPLVARIGGKTGWYFGSTLWRLRGLLDQWIGGVGLRRGRRHATDIRPGDALDFWRVLEVNPPHRLLLLAEMKTPGDALLDIRIEEAPSGGAEVQLAARFLPRGLPGILYWYCLYPLHGWIFGGMLSAIAREARRPLREGPRKFRSVYQPACEK
ncbi:MAG: SDR family oxidoreductase [Thermodesulfobacteriota bacterium]